MMSRSTSPATSTKLAAKETSSAPSQLMPLETTLNSFIEQQTLFNNKLSNLMSEQQTQQKQFNNQLSGLMREQNEKLNDIRIIAKSLEEQQLKIKKLEENNINLSKQMMEVRQQNDSLVKDVDFLKHNTQSVNSSSSPEIIISGIPAMLNLEPCEITEKVLAALDSPQMNIYVLDTRKIENKIKSGPNSTGDQNVKSSYIVKFASEHIARHVINLKRRKGLLAVQNVFKCNISGNIYVNEFLTASTHTLYRKTKELAKLHKWKYVWVKDSKIFARRNDSTEMLKISTDNDLNLMISTD
ncbi:hypothetical protein PV325_012602 [Microctonus aethiopoides]|nr:hypothetical protein PV325_012602 [Microctonus aethiopoides]